MRASPMTSLHAIRRARAFALRAVVIAMAAGGLVACDGDELIDPPFADTAKPRVSMIRGNNPPDSLLVFSVTAKDDIGLKAIRVQLAGGFTATIDTTFNSAIQEFTYNVTARVPASAPLGSTVIVTSMAEDGAGNRSDTASLVLTVGNLVPPTALITSPVGGQSRGARQGTRALAQRSRHLPGPHARLCHVGRLQHGRFHRLWRRALRLRGPARHALRAR
jgi:hypothetical protein